MFNFLKKYRKVKKELRKERIANKRLLAKCDLLEEQVAGWVASSEVILTELGELRSVFEDRLPSVGVAE